MDGMFYSGVCVQTATSSDSGYLQCSETITFGATSKMKLFPRNQAGQLVSVGGEIGQFWLIARARLSFSEQLPTAVQSYVAPSYIEEREILKVTLTGIFNNLPV